MIEPKRKSLPAPEIFQVRLADLDPGIAPVGVAPGTPASGCWTPQADTGTGLDQEYAMAVAMRGGA